MFSSKLMFRVSLDKFQEVESLGHKFELLDVYFVNVFNHVA